MNLTEWLDNYETIPNKYRRDMGFDFGHGCVLMLAPELELTTSDHSLTDDHIWSLIESNINDKLYITHGFHDDALGWFATLSAPHTPVFDDILID